MTIINVTYSVPRTRVDTVVNAVGDVRIDELGTDMAVLLAIVSSSKNKEKIRVRSCIPVIPVVPIATGAEQATKLGALGTRK